MVLRPLGDAGRAAVAGQGEADHSGAIVESETVVACLYYITYGVHIGNHIVQGSWRDGLSTVAYGLTWIVMDFDNEPVGTTCDGSARHWADHLAAARGVTGVDNHRKIGHALEGCHGTEV